jgi:arginine decarboxylase
MQTKEEKTMDSGCRIPTKYFVTSGAGQSSAGPGDDHWETCSYDLALLDAGIENFNVMTYTSVLPPESEEISLDDARQYFHHGAVLETIKAQMNGVQGEHLCAGVGRCWVYKDSDIRAGGQPAKRELVGGFAAEYEGNASLEAAAKFLEQDLEGIFQRRYGQQPEYKMSKPEIATRDLVVDEAFGTVFVALCFVAYKFPEINHA